jgi:glycosyltransferase involved in cell wall biosynthesis
MNYPRITVVTPSYNQGQFLEETIRSVIGQGYPNLEYIIMDGGSTDDSVQIIKKYAKHLACWVSEEDNGQSVAINKGFSIATGDILSWLNSDDMYMPGALFRVASRLDIARAGLIFGNCLHFADGKRLTAGSDVRRLHREKNLLLFDYIIQPSSFWTRRAWQRTGPLDESLVFAFDWDWFIRAQKAGVTLIPDDKYLSLYRMHEQRKTATGADKRLRELAGIYSRHAGLEYARLFSRCCDQYRSLWFFKKWLRRFRLSEIEDVVLKAAFPHLFFGFNREVVRDIVDMTN